MRSKLHSLTPNGWAARQDWRLEAVFVGCVCLFSASATAKEKTQQLRFEFAGRLRTYYFFALDAEEPVPLVVLLHGSGRDGRVMIGAWRSLASREHFAIVAPDSFDRSH